MLAYKILTLILSISGNSSEKLHYGNVVFKPYWVLLLSTDLIHHSQALGLYTNYHLFVALWYRTEPFDTPLVRRSKFNAIGFAPPFHS